VKSLKTQLDELYEALQAGTVDFSPWEESFIASVHDQAKGDTKRLSEKQVEKIDGIHAKYFDS